jgi:hypothetical protein
MRAFLLGMPLIAVLSTQVGFAADIDFDLSKKNVTELSEEKVAKPFSMKVKDRVWIYKGIEEGTEQEAEAHSVSSSTSQCVRYEPSPDGTHVSRIVYYADFAARAPDWIDDGLWPRTKELLKYAKEPLPVPLGSETVVFLGPPVITR